MLAHVPSSNARSLTAKAPGVRPRELQPARGRALHSLQGCQLKQLSSHNVSPAMISAPKQTLAGDQPSSSRNSLHTVNRLHTNLQVAGFQRCKGEFACSTM